MSSKYDNDSLFFKSPRRQTSSSVSSTTTPQGGKMFAFRLLLGQLHVDLLMWPHLLPGCSKLDETHILVLGMASTIFAKQRKCFGVDGHSEISMEQEFRLENEGF